MTSIVILQAPSPEVAERALVLLQSQIPELSVLTPSHTEQPKPTSDQDAAFEGIKRFLSEAPGVAERLKVGILRRGLWLEHEHWATEHGYPRVSESDGSFRRMVEAAGIERTKYNGQNRYRGVVNRAASCPTEKGRFSRTKAHLRRLGPSDGIPALPSVTTTHQDEAQACLELFIRDQLVIDQHRDNRVPRQELRDVYEHWAEVYGYPVVPRNTKDFKTTLMRAGITETKYKGKRYFRGLAFKDLTHQQEGASDE